MTRALPPFRRAMHRIVLFLLALGASMVSGAGTLAFVNGTIHTVSGPALTNAAVFANGGRITAVGPIPPGGITADTVVDLQGGHLYPGLIAPHTVLGLIEIDGVRSTRDTTEVGAFRPDVFAWVAVHPDSELIPVGRANGYTHAQVVPQGGVVSGFSAVIALEGWTQESMAVRKAAALHVFWPDFGLDPTPKDRAGNPDNWKSMEDQVRDREKRLREIDDFFEDAETYVKARKAVLGDAPPHPAAGLAGVRPPVEAGFRVVPAWEAMLPVINGSLPVFLHADETRQIRSAVEWALSRELRVVLAGGRDAAKIAGFLAENRIPVAYEDVYTLPVRDTDPYDAQFSAPVLLARAGVRVSFAGGANRFGASNLRNVPYAAAHAVAFGLSADEALRGLTLYPAEILGMADRLGSIEPGKECSVFWADGDILDIRTRVRRLWIEGREVTVDSRHTRLYERYRNRPSPR